MTVLDFQFSLTQKGVVEVNIMVNSGKLNWSKPQDTGYFIFMIIWNIPKHWTLGVDNKATRPTWPKHQKQNMRRTLLQNLQGVLPKIGVHRVQTSTWKNLVNLRQYHLAGLQA